METTYRNRRAHRIETGALRLTVLVEGGHIAEILHKPTGINPLWTPPWPSMEPSAFDAEHPADYGNDAESKLLAGIMGHNLCMDIFGGPSEEEAAAGLTVHGEASVARYELKSADRELVARAEFPEARLRLERRVALGEQAVRLTEIVENVSATDRPIAWTQHVTLGPPFLEKGRTLFRASATRSKVFEGEFGAAGYLKPGAEFDWPHAPHKNGRDTVDLRVFTDAAASGAFTTHLMEPRRGQAFFLAWSPASRLLFGYIWKQRDFPWLGIWEENYSRQTPPWNGQTLTRGMEFGVSPMPETRRAMVERGSLFSTPGYRWIPAHGSVRADYCAFAREAASLPEEAWWDGADRVTFG